MRYLKLTVCALTALGILAGAAYPNALVGSSGSMFTDIKARDVGDILTVNIYEDAQATNTSSSDTKKEGKFDTQGGPGIGTLDFIPLFGASGQNTNEYKGSGNSTRRGSLKARMTVNVIAVKNNGDLVIEGHRTIRINNDDETLTLAGVVRSQDVNSDNSVNSYNIADAQISYSGKGPISTGARPGIVMRFLNWIF